MKFSVSTKESDRMTDAVASYVFNLISLGARFNISDRGVHELEDQCNEAFKQVLGDLVVCITVDDSRQFRVTLV